MAESPGAKLKETREAQGKNLSQVAKATRIGLQQLEGIEQDNYDRIPAEIYVKGFVKNYAQHLGLDPAPLLEEVEVLLTGGGAAAPTPRAGSSIPEPVDETEEDFQVVKEPLPPRIQGPSSSLAETVRESVSGMWNQITSMRLPVDRRLVLIGVTIVVVLLVVGVMRSCSGAPEEAPFPVDSFSTEELENLLIATPEPVLFELPRTTP